MASVEGMQQPPEISPLLEKTHPRILVVDDEPSLLRLMNHVLTPSEYEVIGVTNCREAMTYLQSGSIDAVIVDAVMPLMNGYDFTKILRRHPLFASLPIFMLSRKRERADVERALQAGVSDYLVKPLDPSLLIDKLNLTLKSPQKDREMFEIQFPEGVIDSTIQMAANVVGVSESGLTLLSAAEMAPRMSVQVDSPLFKEIGIRIPICTVVSSQRLDHSHQVKIKFVGLNEEELQRIRTWVNRESVKRRK